ncbi:hypothetical protein C3737_17955 [Aeromonas jandaei]|uniref:PIN domain-containing protein n=1 Tax=Aeromonas jandaei TaxID=650 RepID=UPI000CE190B2|nr:PIN domain-containing protein [Aeromonas jandaei]PPA28529.1 hypothetical protein C3737_17955 [Aeromonas jandaei]
MLETKYVFIDTQYFVKNNFNFASSSLATFKEICQRDELCYLLTSVVKKEVERRIETSIKEALSSLQSFRKKGNVLSTIDDSVLSQLFIDVREEDVQRKAKQAFHKYNSECKCEDIDANYINVEKLLQLYFDKKPPFSDGKKKFEFPDAISLLSLEEYLRENEKLYVVSDDSDLKSYCNNHRQFISIDSLEKLLDIYNQYTNVRTDKIKEYIEDNEPRFKEEISKYISTCDVYNDSTWEDSEVVKFSVSSVGDFEVNVIQVNNEECRLNIDTEVELNVLVTGPDFINAVYDKEDGNVFILDFTTREEVVPLELTCEIELAYEYENGKLTNVIIYNIDIPSTYGGIDVNVEEQPEHDLY